MWNFKKHILKSAEDQAAPSCPDRAVVIQVCNQNSAKDDNFEVYLNGTYIGFLDLSQDAQVGSVMIATTNPNLDVLVGDFACPLNLMQTYRFDPNLLLFGLNTLQMKNVQNNNNGNKGTVSIRNYEIVDNDLINPCVVADLEYGYAPSGVDFTMNFTYTACCPGELDETIIAFKDTYTASFGAGIAGQNILVNDSLNGNSVTTSNVTINQVYSSSPLVAINETTGEITADVSTPIGEYTLVYEICEISNPANCDQTTIKVVITEATTTTTTSAPIALSMTLFGTDTQFQACADIATGAPSVFLTTRYATSSYINPGQTIYDGPGLTNPTTGPVPVYYGYYIGSLYAWIQVGTDGIVISSGYCA